MWQKAGTMLWYNALVEFGSGTGFNKKGIYDLKSSLVPCVEKIYCAFVTVNFYRYF
jgi:hypothetical protein